MRRTQQFRTSRGAPVTSHPWALLALAIPFGATFCRPAFADQPRGGNEGPVRMARVVVVTGDVDWRHDPQSRWAGLSRNMPIREGAQISVPPGGKAEIAFDDGSRMRLGENAVATLQTLYSDADGEFTEITLTEGPAIFRLANKFSVYQIDTPTVAVKAGGPARFKVFAGDKTDVVDWAGTLAIEGPQGKTTVVAGQCLRDADTRSPYRMTSLPRPDNFDNWSTNRDRKIDDYGTSTHAQHHIPSDIALASDNLDDYGTWRQDNRYGDVWVPRESSASWRPYSSGDWVWVEPMGWTWVGDEPWGYAPYHYGTWIHEPYGWAWCPGPSHQYWSPANVVFTSYGDSLAWAPMAPSEIVYPPALSIGFRGGDWSLFFSIGQAAVYYPTYYQSRYAFVADPWYTPYVNRTVFMGGPRVVNNVTINNIIVNRRFINDRRFVPVNVRAGGVMLASARTFGRAGRFRALDPTRSVAVFTKGRMIAGPKASRTPISGPIVRPTELALARSRTFRPAPRVTQAALNRPVYRAPLPAHIAKASAQIPVRTLTAAQIGASARTGRPRSAAAKIAAGTAAAAAGLTAAQRARQARQSIGLRTTVPNNPGNAKFMSPHLGAGAPGQARRSGQVAATGRSQAAQRAAAARQAVGAQRMAAHAGAQRAQASNAHAQAVRAGAARQAAQAHRVAAASHASSHGTANSHRMAANTSAHAQHVQHAQHAQHVQHAQTMARERRSEAASAAAHRSSVGQSRKEIATNRPRPQNRSFYRQQPPSDYGRQHEQRNYRQSQPPPVQRRQPQRSTERRSSDRSPRSMPNDGRTHAVERRGPGGGGDRARERDRRNRGNPG